MGVQSIQAVKGMNDLLPQQSPLWQYVENKITGVLHAYGYQEVRFPILEKTELFKRGIGEVTDIVEKEMYTFDDSGGSLTMRPEGTASCVRACEQHKLLFDRGNVVQKLWYMGPMFRRERPQKGRLRQFHQVGVEAFGLAGPDIDTELLLMTARLWQEFGIADALELQINSLGTSESRESYRSALVEFLMQNRHALDRDSVNRIERNPLRVLDSKDLGTQKVLVNAPLLSDYLDAESREHFDQLKVMLDTLGVSYQVNPKLVRGLDYYGKTVFEWTTDRLGAQGTVCAGGRYDGLVAELGGKSTPGVGFAMGIERLVLLLEELSVVPEDIFRSADVYVVFTELAASHAFRLAETLRSEAPHVRVQMHCGGGNLKSQMKKADKSGAAIALILGEEEIANGLVAVKFLREEKQQQTLTLEDIVKILE